MKRTLRGLFAATATLCALASTSYAQNITIKDGTGASQTLCTGTVSGAVVPCQGAPNYPSSGVSAVTSTLTAAGASASFTPIAGRTFHVQLSNAATAGCYLERQLDGATWTEITVTSNGSTVPMYNWTYSGTALSEDVTESQSAVPYRVDCGAALGSFTSGALGVRFSQ